MVNNMRIAIDAGHSYNTAGKRSPAFLKDVTNKFGDHVVTVKKGECFREHVANAGVAYYLAKELERCGVDIFKSGWTGLDGTKDLTDLSIVARQTAIRNAKCDYVISIHYNAYGDSKTFNNAQGCEAFYHSYDYKAINGKAFATAIQSQLISTFPEQVNRGVKNSSSYGMCNSLGMGVKASCLIELAFMTNQYEAENYLANPYAWYKYAVQIAKGVCQYVGINYIPYMPKVSVTHLSTIEDIAWLQHRLNCNGANLVPDGIYGPKTKQAVTEYYKEYFNVSSDGNKVWSKAISKLAN